MDSLGRRFTLRDNFDEVTRLYIYEYSDTVEIGKRFGVSSSSVQEIMNKEFPGWEIEKVEGDDTTYRIFNPSNLEAAIICAKD